MTIKERETIRAIREAVAKGILAEPFNPASVNRALMITFAGTFLPKHRVGNPGWRGKVNTEHFVRVSQQPALYRLR